MLSSLAIGNVVISALLFKKYQNRFDRKFASHGYKIDNKKAALTPGSLLLCFPGLNILSSLVFDIYYLLYDDKFDKKLYKKLSKKGLIKKINNNHKLDSQAAPKAEFQDDVVLGDSFEMGTGKTQSKSSIQASKDDSYSKLSNEEKIILLKKERDLLTGKTNSVKKSSSNQDELDAMFESCEDVVIDKKGRGSK